MSLVILLARVFVACYDASSTCLPLPSPRSHLSRIARPKLPTESRDAAGGPCSHSARPARVVHFRWVDKSVQKVSVQVIPLLLGQGFVVRPNLNYMVQTLRRLLGKATSLVDLQTILSNALLQSAHLLVGERLKVAELDGAQSAYRCCGLFGRHGVSC